jgi:metallophosphoesterase superfamily enzyme
MVPFSFGGHALLALAQGALFWPERRALLVADLHFEKASWFAQRGQMLPPYDSIATLADLTALVTATGAREVWCLGDSFHDSDGCERLPQRAQDMLRAMTDGTRWPSTAPRSRPVGDATGTVGAFPSEAAAARAG